MRAAIVGVGNVALAGHLPAWLERSDVSIVAAGDPRESGRKELESRVPGIRWYASTRELLEQERLDFVDVCAPPALHAEISGKALERGLHVLCEKPLVMRPGDLPRLAGLAARSDR